MKSAKDSASSEEETDLEKQKVDTMVIVVC
jgi:hypothetical protein